MTLEYQLALAQHEEQLLRAELEKQKADFNDLFVRAKSLEQENADLRHKRALYDAVRQRLDEKNIERNVPSTIEVSPAFSPSKPAHDRRIMFTAIAVVLALLIALLTRSITLRRGSTTTPIDVGTKARTT